MSSINELGNLEYAFLINGTFPFFSIFYHKTCQFLIYQKTTQEKAGPSTLPSAVESSSVKSSKSVKSFSEYKTAKGKQWYSKVKGGKAKGTKTSAADQEVLIYIGLLEWNVMFAGGTPVNSTYNIQNGYFQSCGEIVAVSLAQCGPPPCFLDACVYDTLVFPETDFNNLNEKHITPEEKRMLDSIQNDLGSHSDTIVDHGYTGQIDQEHISDITGSILISLIPKRQVYLKEFMKGLEL